MPSLFRSLTCTDGFLWNCLFVRLIGLLYTFKWTPWFDTFIMRCLLWWALIDILPVRCHYMSYITCSPISVCLFPSECSLTKLILAWRCNLPWSEKHSMNHRHTHPSRVVMFLPVPGIVIRCWLAQIYSCLSCRLATTLCSTPFSMRTHNCTSPPSNLPPRERKSSPFVKFLHRRWGIFFFPERLLKNLLNSAPVNQQWQLLALWVAFSSVFQIRGISPDENRHPSSHKQGLCAAMLNN